MLGLWVFILFFTSSLLSSVVVVSVAKNENSLKWWELEYSAVRTLSAKCSSDLSNKTSLKEMMAEGGLLDQYQQSGIKVVNLNSVYDSGVYPEGVDPRDLWCGLVLSQLDTLDPYLGTNEDWHNFMSAAKSKGMKVVSWLNINYIYLYSPLYLDAVADLQAYNLNLDQIRVEKPESTALWFTFEFSSNWCLPQQWGQEYTKGAGGWVCAPEICENCAFYSIFARQPAPDFGNSYYQQYVQKNLIWWVDEMKLDGFLFDAPYEYLIGGITPVTNNPYAYRNYTTYLNITRPKSDIVFMAEYYTSSNINEIFWELGFDVYLADTYENGYYGLGPNMATISKAIAYKYSSDLESGFFHSITGLEQVKQMCFYFGFEHCGSAYQTAVTFYPDGTAMNAQEQRLVTAMMTVHGYVTTYALNNIHYWWNADHIESIRNDSDTKLLLDTISSNLAFARKGSIRYPLSTDSPTTIAMIYHNVFEGDAAVVVFNVNSHSVQDTITFGTVESTVVCKTATPSDACYESITWAKSVGIIEHPDWYPSNFTTDTSRNDFQYYLYIDVPDQCPWPTCTNGEPEIIIDESPDGWGKYLPTTLTDLISGQNNTVSQEQMQYSLPALGYSLYSGFTLPTWTLANNVIHQDCTGNGVTQTINNIPLASCLHFCYNDNNCLAVSVVWLSQNVNCYLLSGTNNTQCTDNDSYSSYIVKK